MDDEDGPLSSMLSSIHMLCLGIVLFPLTLLLLGWNENHFVCEDARILYAQARAEAVGCDASLVANKFGFFSCPLVQSSLELFTPCTFNREHPMSCAAQFPVSFLAASGRQTVEMYQCQESCREEKQRNNLGQNVEVTTCTYSMGWFQTYVRSSDFRKTPAEIAQGCPNYQVALRNPDPPSNLDMGTSTAYANQLLAGDSASKAYSLTEELGHQLSPDQPVGLASFAGNFTGPAATVQSWTRPLAVSAANLMIEGNYLKTCRVDTLGCIRIKYSMSSATAPSVITHVGSAGQTGPEAVPGSWGCSGAPWQAIEPVPMSKAEMIEALQAENKATTWILRILGLCLAWAAVYCCFQPVAAAAGAVGDCVNFLPCGGYLQDMLEGVVQQVICCMSCGIGCSSGLLVMALVWLFMRPLYGGLMLAASLCLCFCAAAARSQTTAARKGAIPSSDESSDEEFG